MNGSVFLNVLRKPTRICESITMYDYYGVYTACRNAAWQCILDFKPHSLPIKIKALAKAAGIKVVRNSYVNELRPGEQGASIFTRGQWYIIYDDSLSSEDSRVILAHELGHILLGHEYKYAERRFDQKGKKLKSEQEADMFAIRILAPACVLHELGVKDAEDIAVLCDIPMSVAKERARRMAVLEERGMFYKSRLESSVMKLFDGYINEHRGTPYRRDKKENFSEIE